MGTCMLNSISDVNSLVALAQASNEPVIVFDGEDECLVVMRPAVLDRILFDTDLVNAAAPRETLRF